MTYEEQYIALLEKCLSKGIIGHNKRTGQKVYRLFAEHLIADKSDILPLTVSRRIYPKTAAAELAWSLLGDKSVDFISAYSKIWDKFAINGEIEAAYGYRWRKHFNRDQIKEAIELLKQDPSTRQAVIMAWDPAADGLLSPAKTNIPCPLGFQMTITGQMLNIHIFQRSADLILGTPYDMLFYCLLNCAIAEELHIEPGKTAMSITDAHVYGYLEETARAQISIYHGSLYKTKNTPINSMPLSQIEKNPHGYVTAIIEQAKYTPLWTSKKLEPVL